MQALRLLGFALFKRGGGRLAGHAGERDFRGSRIFLLRISLL
jgi:hypothetical protein